MKSRIIAVVQLVAEAGRTTIATTLAGELARFNRVALIDCDGVHGRSAQWGAVRQQETYSPNFLVQTASTPVALLERLYRLREGVDFIIIDGPAANGEITSAIMAIADLCLMPIDSSSPNRSKNPQFVALLEEARKLRKVRVRVVRTRHQRAARSQPPLPAQREHYQPANSALRLAILKHSLGLRPAYPEALAAGRTAAESKDPIARDEVQALAMEIKLLLRPNVPSNTKGFTDQWADTISGGPLGPRSVIHLIG